MNRQWISLLVRPILEHIYSTLRRNQDLMSNVSLNVNIDGHQPKPRITIFSKPLLLIFILIN